MSISTKTGDNGHTSLPGGRRVSKSDSRVDCYGTLDELISQLGFARSVCAEAEVSALIKDIQQDLFRIAAAVGTPSDASEPPPEITSQMVEAIDNQVHRIEAVPGILGDWSLPGELTASAAMDVARTVCRRSERLVVQTLGIRRRVSCSCDRLPESSFGFVVVVGASDRSSGRIRCIFAAQKRTGKTMVAGMVGDIRPDAAYSRLLEETLDQIEPVDAARIRRAETRQLQLTKPPNSLGRLEEVANRLAAILQTETPAVRRPHILLFAGDHGVCAEGVSPYPQAVTAQMVANFLRGGAAINAIAKTVEADLLIVDVGVAHKIPVVEGLIARRIASGTNNFCRQAAMSEGQARAALAAGMEMADLAVSRGCNLIGIGEMGIGNTTVASALTSALTGVAPASVVDRGTGADDACMRRKISAVERAIQLHQPQRDHPLKLLASMGGFEIAAMAGVCLRAATHRCAVVVDGFIATAAAAVAVRLHANVSQYLFAAHQSTERGHRLLLELIGQVPMLDLQMRLGEGTGAALVIPLIRAAANALSSMATFESASVSDASSRRAHDP